MLCGVTSKLGAQEDIDAGGGCSFTSGIGPDSPAAVPALMGFVEIVRAKEDETPSCECKIASRWFWLRVKHTRILSLNKAFLTFMMV